MAAFFPILFVAIVVLGAVLAASSGSVWLVAVLAALACAGTVLLLPLP